MQLRAQGRGVRVGCHGPLLPSSIGVLGGGGLGGEGDSVGELLTFILVGEEIGQSSSASTKMSK